MPEKILGVKEYKINNAQEVLTCSCCNGTINLGEKYIKLKLEIGGYYRFKAIFLHYVFEQCKANFPEIKITKRENRAIKKIALHERKVNFAKACSGKEMVTDRQKTKDLFDLGYTLLTTSKDKDSALKEAKALQESEQITEIAFFDGWFEVWAKKV